jgi:predicted RNase H-like nuclease
VDPWRIVGIDCAVDPKKVGVAVGELRADSLVISDAVQCGPISVVDAVENFVGDASRVLIALDAPLGWPVALGRTLAEHRAGMPIESQGHALFRRLSDEVVARETKQIPLDVGANLIARTAAAALADLGRFRARLDAAIPLAWSPPEGDGIYAIEVYPAATLRQLGIEPRAYKEKAHRENRMRILDRLNANAALSAVRDVMEVHADAFDAAVCVIAGADFVSGRCRSPRDDEREAAAHEGWIWFRSN